MKKILCVILIIIASASTVCADITVVINDNELVSDVAPIEQNDRVFVPMRAIFEKLGCKVEWFEDDELIVSVRNKEIMLMQIGSNNISYADMSTDKKNIYTMDVAPIIIEDRTLVPIRAVSETLGCDVKWEEETQTVLISTAER